jgi:hypothetical protein
MGVGTSVISTHGLTTIASDISGSIYELKNYTSDNEARNLSIAYTTLATAVKSSVRNISGASANTIAAQQSTYNTQMNDLDQQKKSILTRLKGKTIGDYLRLISYIIGMSFAIIIVTNAMVSEPWYYKLFFYAPWAVIFYPIVLLYGIYDPPVWHATAIPLFETSSMEWYLKYMGLFLYEPLGTPSKLKTESKLPLRVFTALVIAYWITSQYIT